MVYLLRYVCADMPQFVGKTGLGDLWGAYGVGEGGRGVAGTNSVLHYFKLGRGNPNKIT